jgi:hypothetical protein
MLPANSKNSHHVERKCSQFNLQQQKRTNCHEKTR